MSIRAGLLRTRHNLVTFGWHPGQVGEYSGFGNERVGFCIIGALKHDAPKGETLYGDGSVRAFLDISIEEYTTESFINALDWNDEQKSIESVLAFLDYCLERAPN